MSNTPISQLNQSSPENVVSAPKGSVFSRAGDKFYLTVGNTTTKLATTKKAFALQYQNEIWYPTLNEETITFATSGETWIKKGSGNNKIGWTQLTSNSSRLTRRSVLPIFGDAAAAYAAYDFGYFLKTNGDLWSAGYNDGGQLGIGTDDYKQTASLSLTNVKMAAASCEGYHGIALKNDGTLWFTGYNSYGQAGNGTTDDVNVWTETILEGDITGSTITNVAVGYGYSALLMSNNTLWISSTYGFGMDTTSFVQVASDVKFISGGGYHLLYIDTDNTLWGIGDNDDGELGSGDDSYHNYDDPVQISTNVKFASAMGYHSGFIKNDDTLWMMGYNSYGEVGISPVEAEYVYTPVQIDTDVKFVGGGDSHTLYIKNDGTMYGMGYNYDGQLGLDGWTDVYVPTLIDTNVSYVSGGSAQSAYVKTDKTLYGMGYNYYYQLGSISVYPKALYYSDATGWTSEGVTEFVLNDNYGDEIYWRDVIYADGKFIAGGGEGLTQIRHSNDGKTWNTGSITDVESGIVGLAYNGSNKYVAVSDVSNYYNDGRPELFTSTDGIDWITGSLNNTSYLELLSVTYGGGKFVVGGEDRIVTSPNGDTWTEQSLPIGAYVQGVEYGNGVYVAATTDTSAVNNSHTTTFTQRFVGITASFAAKGDQHFAFIKDGTLYTCGDNRNNQLGLNSNIYSFINLQQVSSNVRNVACGYNQTTFVKNDSTLWVAGQNTDGQFGITDEEYVSPPIQIDTNVSQSFAGSSAQSNILYIKNDNTLWGLGYNLFGQLGTSSLGGYVTQSVQLDTDVVHAAVGLFHILYLKDDNTLWGMGYNAYGQLGTGDNDNRTSSFQIDTNVVYCTTGRDNSYYIKNDGTLYAMGNNANAQLGLGDFSSKNVPTLVTSSVVQVSAARYHASFVTTAGEVYSMGYNTSGQLGIGDDNTYLVPTFATDNASMVSAGHYATSLIKTDGTIYVAGDAFIGEGAISDNGLYSSDGETWYTSSLPDYYYQDVAYGNGRFVMVADDDSLVVSSTDGANWTSSYASTSSVAIFSKVIFDGTKFVACNGDYADGSGYNIFTSTDGVSWTRSKTGDNQYWGALASGGGKYVLLAYGWNDYINPSYKLTID
jgi:alpha-tubulin suppressor-like RCC1 family protein